MLSARRIPVAARRLLWSGTVLFALSIAACTTSPKLVLMDEMDGGWELRRQALLEINRWHLTGRVAVRIDQEAWSANVRWGQRQDAYLLDVYGPLGQGRLRLNGDSEGVTATSREGEQVSARSPEALLFQELGWMLPVSGLRYWVRGIPAPEVPESSLALDELGRLARLEQAGWSIEFSAYGEGDGIDLPRRIRLDNGEIFVRLVIDEWSSSV